MHCAKWSFLAQKYPLIVDELCKDGLVGAKAAGEEGLSPEPPAAGARRSRRS